jgi:hypothetical protein
MNPSKKCIATSCVLGILLMMAAAPASAGVEIGVVTQLSGPLLLKRADGTLKALAVDAFVEQGDVLVTEKDTYAQLRFADESEVTLGPDTLLKIEAYAFNVNATHNLDSIFSLGRGSVRIQTWLSGPARTDLIKLVAPNLLDPAATLTLSRAAGTTFVAQYTAPATSRLAMWDAKYLAAQFRGIQLALSESAIRSDGSVFSWPDDRGQDVLLAQISPPAGPTPTRAPGLYVQVLDGLILVTNPTGTQNFTAGQFGYTPSFTQAPVIVPVNPGIQFSPPPTFNASTAPLSSSPSSGNKSNTVDCEVR